MYTSRESSIWSKSFDKSRQLKDQRVLFNYISKLRGGLIKKADIVEQVRLLENFGGVKQKVIFEFGRY